MRISSKTSSPRSLEGLALGLVLALLGTAPGAAKSAPDTVDSPPEGQEATQASGELSESSETAGEEESNPIVRLSDQFPDREWIFDEETSRRFMIEKVPKLPGAYLWEDENHVRLPGGLFNMEVVDHDDKWFWIKIWDRERRVHRRNKPKDGPSAEEIESIAAAYRSDVETADRLQFESFDEGLPNRGQWRNGFDLGDMNGDGHLDIVFGPARKGRNRPNIFLGDSAGKWTLWREASYPDIPYDYGDAAVGDFNKDGHADFALGIHILGMTVLVGDGEGKFETWSEGISLDRPGKRGAQAFSSRAVETIDWDGDGLLDIIALGEGPKNLRLQPVVGKKERPRIQESRGLRVYLNGGDGTWEALSLDQNPRDFGEDFATGDWNGDGLHDVVLASNVQNNRLLLRTSNAVDGSVQAATLDGLRPHVFTQSVTTIDRGEKGHALALAYTNREGGIWRSGIDIFHPSDSGWERRPLIALEDTRVGFFALEEGDLDGDGHQDLVALDGLGQVYIFLGDGEFFRREASSEMPEPVRGCRGWDARIIDIDGDSRGELVAGFAGESTGFGLAPELTFPGCPDQGSLRVWKAVPREDAQGP